MSPLLASSSLLLYWMMVQVLEVMNRNTIYQERGASVINQDDKIDRLINNKIIDGERTKENHHHHHHFQIQEHYRGTLILFFLLRRAPTEFCKKWVLTNLN